MINSGLCVVSRFVLIVCLLLLKVEIHFNQSLNLSIDQLGSTSSDMIIKEGDSMEINCVLFKSMNVDLEKGTTINSTMLKLTHNGKLIEKSKIQIFNNSTIKYSVRHVSLVDSGDYKCYIDLGDSKMNEIKTTHITIAREPRTNDGFNFTCSGYFMKNLTCSWNQDNYNIDTLYDLQMVKLKNFKSLTCQYVVHSCTFDLRSLTPYLVDQKKFEFTFNVYNKFGSISLNYEIDHYSNVILDPVNDVKLLDVGQRYISLNWKSPQSVGDDPYLNSIIQYQLEICPVQKSLTVVNGSEKHKKILKGIKQLNISDLIPNTMYIMKISCRFGTDAGVGQWNEPFISYFRTMPPGDLYPVLVRGAFELIQKEGNRQDLVIYFEKTSKNQLAGPDFYYMLQIEPINLTTPDSWPQKYDPLSISFDNVTTASDEILCRPSLVTKEKQIVYLDRIIQVVLSSCVVENLDKSFDYRLQMISSNSTDFNSTSSYITVPGVSLNEIHPGVDQLYTIKWIGDNYTLYWSVSSNHSIESFTIFWCQVTNPQYQCDHHIEHIDVPNDKRSIDLTIDLEKDQFDSVQFGISVIDSSKGLSSGITWSSCIEKESFIPINDRFQRFDVTKTGPKSIRANWRLDCPALDHFIDHYELHYCRIDYPCTETLTIIYIVNSTGHNIENLDSNAHYNLTIRALTTRGEILESPTITTETEVNVISFTLMIIMIIAGIVTMSTVLYILISFTIKKRSDEKKLKQSVDSNWIPKMPPRLKGDGNLLFESLSRRDQDKHIGSNTKDSNINFNRINSIKSSSSVSSSSSSSKEQKFRKLSGGCGSEDSGYSTKLSDKNVFFTSSSTISENCDYIVALGDKSSDEKKVNSSNSYNYVPFNVSPSDSSFNNRLTINNNPDDYHHLFSNDYSAKE